MQQLKSFRRGGLGAFLLVLSVAVPVTAQNLTTPPGWTKTFANGNTTYTKGGSRFVIKKLSAVNGNLESWFSAQTAQDIRSRGELVTRGRVNSQQGALTVAHTVRTSSGNQSVVYTGYPVGGQGRLIVVSNSNPLSLLQDLKELNNLGQELGAYDTSSGGKAKTGTAIGKSGVRTTKTTKSRPVNKLAPVAAKGTLKNSQILGIFLDENYTFGVGGMMVLEYDPILLLRDGSARRDLEIPPLDLNLAQDKASNRKDWGRWTKSGAKYLVKFGNDKPDEVKASFKVRAARPGETLKRGYSTIGGGGNTAMGGDVMIAYSSSYQFSPDGRFANSKGGGGSTSSVTAYSNSKSGGKYRLDGYSLTLRYNDGKVVRRLFYFYPNDKEADVIGIGDSSYVHED